MQESLGSNQHTDVVRQLQFSDLKARPSYPNERATDVLRGYEQSLGNPQARTVGPVQCSLKVAPPLPQVSVDKQILQENFRITRPNYYCSQQTFLHYFSGNYIYVYNVGLVKPKWEKIKLQLPFQAKSLPKKYRSIVTPQGDIYLIGGIWGNRLENSVFKLNQYSGVMEVVENCQLRYSRINFGLCYCDNYLYIVGGETLNKEILELCEVFDLKQQAVLQIQSLKTGVSNPSLCSFSDHYVFCVGGIEQKGLLSQSVERYSPIDNAWTTLKVDTSSSPFPGFLQCSGAVQINNNFIMIFGGYDAKSQDKNHTYLLEVGGTSCKVVAYKSLFMKAKISFPKGSVFVHDKCVFGLGSTRFWKQLSE